VGGDSKQQGRVHNSHSGPSYCDNRGESSKGGNRVGKLWGRGDPRKRSECGVEEGFLWTPSKHMRVVRRKSSEDYKRGGMLAATKQRDDGKIGHPGEVQPPF